jgi:hypothetical protein
MSPARSRECAGRGEIAVNHSPNEGALRPSPGTPWFTAIRSDEVMELILASRNAFILAYIIGYRARWKDGFNRHGLEQGEAMLGDFETYGMTEQEYRTAKTQLSQFGFATFRATTRGTIGKLMDTRLFALLPPERNEQNNGQATDRQRTGNGRVTTTGRLKEGKTVKTENVVAGERSFVPGTNDQW